jgi:hypothetical protein
VVEPEASGIEAALDAWLAPFLDLLGRKTRRRRAPCTCTACSAQTAARAYWAAKVISSVGPGLPHLPLVTRNAARPVPSQFGMVVATSPSPVLT